MSREPSGNRSKTGRSAHFRARRRGDARVEALEVRRLLSAATVAPPISIVVNSTRDDVHSTTSKTITLRDAITRANQGKGGGVHHIRPGDFCDAQDD